ncbi:MAG: ribosomal L7Ae/L30e/S12e/Gadd45 family protein [Clostridium sp.]|nr:ribosomal L7Ae/L30e/S12e/Gadd45 family protein [Clostridium sp.]
MVNRIEGEKVIGLKQTIKSIKNGEGKCLYIAKDADTKLISPVIQLAKERSLQVTYIETMKELGTLCGIEVGSAVALVLEP